MRRCRTGFCVRRAPSTIWRFSCLDSATPSTCRSSTTPRISCWNRGWDVLRVEYAYNKHPEFQTLPEPERDRWLLADTTAAWRAGLGQRTYERVVLIGKSLGTLAMGHLLTMAEPASHRGSRLADATARRGTATPADSQYGGPSLFVIGTADPHFDPVVLEKMQVATIGEAVVVRNADHGMDIPGDPIASVRAVERVVEALGRFLA